MGQFQGVSGIPGRVSIFIFEPNSLSGGFREGTANPFLAVPIEDKSIFWGAPKTMTKKKCCHAKPGFSLGDAVSWFRGPLVQRLDNPLEKM